MSFHDCGVATFGWPLLLDYFGFGWTCWDPGLSWPMCRKPHCASDLLFDWPVDEHFAYLALPEPYFCFRTTRGIAGYHNRMNGQVVFIGNGILAVLLNGLKCKMANK